MHKKFLTSVFALLGGVALVGSGYSAFTFIKGQQEQTINGSVVVGGLFDGMTFAVKQNGTETDFSGFTLTLDQGKPNSTVVSEGVTINGKETESVDLKVSFDEYGDLQDILDTNTVTLKWNVELQGAVATYVELSSTTSGEQQISKASDLTDGKLSFDVDLTFKYKDTQKPTNADLVGTMSSYVTSGEAPKLVFTVECEFGTK